MRFFTGMPSIEVGVPKVQNLSPENQSLFYRLRGERRWRSPQLPDCGICGDSIEVAEEFFRRKLGVDKLPEDFVIETY
jgi:hypothetical protein